MNEVNENEVYIPEYNPQKYKKAYKITKTISIVLLALAFVLAISVALYGYLDDNSFVWNVNGVPTKDYFTVWMNIIIAFIIPAVLSLLAFVLYKRLKQANAVFSQVDQQKRLEGHLEFDKQAKTAAKIHAAYAASQLAQDIKDITSKK